MSAGFKEVDAKIDAKIDKLGSDILATLNGMQNARYVAAEFANALSVHQLPLTKAEMVELEEHFSKKYAERSQPRRAEKLPPTLPAVGSSASAESAK